jgi:hypothetical protein
LFRWAAGDNDPHQDNNNRPLEQEREEDGAKMIRAFRESVLWYLRRSLESVAEVQRGMVEKRIERAREKEKSALYKLRGGPGGNFPGLESSGAGSGSAAGTGLEGITGGGAAAAAPAGSINHQRGFSVSDPVSAMTAEEVADIESQLSPEQLQLFAQENDFMLKQYEDTLSKVQYVHPLPLTYNPTIFVLNHLLNEIHTEMLKNRSSKFLRCNRLLSAI